MERRAWTQNEDNAIRDLVNRYGIKKWTTISEKMEKVYHLKPRSGKQCRERWYNHLDPQINKQDWTIEEERIIFAAHKKYGNKWADISKCLVGRTDNSVKNHFYSTLRKSLRRINKFLGDRNSTVQVKEIKPGVLSKIFSLIESRFTDTDENYKKLLQQSDNIKDCLFNFAYLKPTKTKNSYHNENLKNIIQEIIEFKQNYNLSQLYKQQKKTKNHQKIYIQNEPKRKLTKRKNSFEDQDALYKKEYLKQVETKYFVNQKKLNDQIQRKIYIFQVKDKQQINKNIINIKQLYIDKRSQIIAKNATDIIYDSVYQEFEQFEKPIKQKNIKYDMDKFYDKVNQLKKEENLDSMEKLQIKKEESSENILYEYKYNHNLINKEEEEFFFNNTQTIQTPTPHINNHYQSKSIAYSYNLELNLSPKNFTPLNSVNINPITVTPREKWTNGIQTCGSQQAWIQVQNTGQEKRFDQIVNDLRNQIGKNQEKKSMDDGFVKSPVSSFTFFQKKD